MIFNIASSFYLCHLALLLPCLILPTSSQAFQEYPAQSLVLWASFVYDISLKRLVFLQERKFSSQWKHSDLSTLLLPGGGRGYKVEEQIRNAFLGKTNYFTRTCSNFPIYCRNTGKKIYYTSFDNMSIGVKTIQSPIFLWLCDYIIYQDVTDTISLLLMLLWNVIFFMFTQIWNRWRRQFS